MIQWETDEKMKRLLSYLAELRRFLAVLLKFNHTWAPSMSDCLRLKGLLSATGPEWRTIRKIVSHHLDFRLNGSLLSLNDPSQQEPLFSCSRIPLLFSILIPCPLLLVALFFSTRPLDLKIEHFPWIGCLFKWINLPSPLLSCRKRKSRTRRRRQRGQYWTW